MHHSPQASCTWASNMELKTHHCWWVILAARIELEFYPGKEPPWCFRNSFIVMRALRHRPDGHTCVHSCVFNREINTKILIQLAIRLSLKSYKRTVSSLKKETIQCVINCLWRHCRCCSVHEFEKKTTQLLHLIKPESQAHAGFSLSIPAEPCQLALNH